MSASRRRKRVMSRSLIIALFEEEMSSFLVTWRILGNQNRFGELWGPFRCKLSVHFGSGSIHSLLPHSEFGTRRKHSERTPFCYRLAFTPSLVAHRIPIVREISNKKRCIFFFSHLVTLTLVSARVGLCHGDNLCSHLTILAFGCTYIRLRSYVRVVHKIITASRRLLC